MTRLARLLVAAIAAAAVLDLLRAWRQAIATEARREYGDTPASRSAIGIEAVLTWPRPLAHFRAGKPEKGLRADAPDAKPSKPDADKAARAVLDALTGIAYVDDAQVTELIVRKRWGDAPGAVIAIREGGSE